MSRTRLASLHFLTSLLGSVTTMIVGLFVTRYILRWLGEQAFGAVRVATDWMGYLTLLDLGIGTALYALFSKSIATGEDKDQRETLSTAVRAYLFVTLLMLVVGLVLASRIERLVPVSPDLVVDLRRGFFVGLFVLAVAPLFPFRAFIEASQEGYRINLLMAAQGLSSALLTAIAARAGFGITGQFAAAAIAQLPVPCLLARKVLSKYPGILLEGFRKRASAAKWRELWQLNGSVLVINFGARISLATDSIVLALLMGPAAVVPLVLTQRAAQTAQAQVLTLGNASWSGLADLHARGDHETFRKRLIDATQLSAVLAAACLSPLVVFTFPFVSIWVGPAQYAGDLVIIVVAIDAFLQTLFSLWVWAFMGTGTLKPLLPFSVASAVVNIFASVLCTQRLGVIGPVLGTLVSYVAVYCWGLPFLLRGHFGVSLWSLLRTAGAPLLLGAGFSTALHFLTRGHLPRTWLTLLLDLGVTGTCYLVVSWFVILRADDRAAWWSRLKHVMPARFPFFAAR